MVVIRKNFNFCLHIPISYYSKAKVEDQPFLFEYLYKPDSERYYRNLKYVYSLDQYYYEVESVIRGILVKEPLLDSVESWRYIRITSTKNSNQLCNKLLSLNSFSSSFNDLLYGKKDIFLNNVPVDCLHQYFYGVSMDNFIEEISPYCEIVDEEYFRSKRLSLIGEVYSDRYIVDRFQREDCFYLEDVFFNRKIFDSILQRLKKTEVSYTLTYFIYLLNKLNL